MKLALLFGYSYSGSQENETLKSSYLDLFTAYEYVNKRGFECVVFDDFERKERIKPGEAKTSNVSFAVFHGKSFSSQCLCMGKSSPFQKTIEEKIEKCDNLFIYYTGHMTQENELCFPFGNVSLKSFFTRIGNRAKRTCQIFCVVDSCYSKGNLFPYSFDRENGKICFETNDLFTIPQDCIYLHSADVAQSAISSLSRSHFTKYAFEQLEMSMGSFSLLLCEIQKRLDHRTYRTNKKTITQTAGISCSKRIPPRVWPWVFGFGFVVTDDYVIF